MKALPANTGTKRPSIVPFLIAFFISDTVSSSSPKYFSKISSSASAITSSKVCLLAFASSSLSSGMSLMSHSEPSSFDQVCAFISTKSITPTKFSSAPIGMCSTAGFASSLSTIDCTSKSKSAPVLSSLFTKQILGTLYLSA